ncbi:MAG: glycosyltransferase family 4 protein [Calditrichaeota bacterium]|nr:glycosyltransferase family 4 protein [Calditrichota bacterium]MCB0268700.1 glycosyltransferase family 4 protein [Calditrichota bacterium]
MLKIYYICAVDLSNFDAQRTHILEVISEMQTLGNDVMLLLPRFQSTIENFPFNICPINVLLKSSKLKFVEYEIRLFFVLLWRCLRNRPDVLFTRKGFLTIAPGIIGKILRIKTVLEVNGIVADEVKSAFGLPDVAVAIFEKIERWNCRISDKIIAVTDGLKSMISGRFSVDKSRIIVISNGVNIHRFHPNGRLTGTGIRLGFVGNLVNWAGVEILVRSLPLIRQHFQNVELLIVGDGQERRDLENLVQSQNVQSQVTFAGKVAPQEVPDFINQCDICYVPAIAGRNSKIGGSSLKLYEYLACGKPVIVSDIPGLDMVRTHQLGRVVPPGDVAALASATIDLLRNPDELRTIATRARAIAEEQFTWTQTTKKILEVCAKKG